MSSASKILGSRVQLFRKRSGLTQKDLAEQMGFTAAETVSQIERGDREVKAWELVQLANALSTEIDDLLRVEKPKAKPAVLWRESPEHQKAKKEAEFLKRCGDYAVLEELNEVKHNRQLPQMEIESNDLTWVTARAIANKVRRELDLGNRPARELEKTLQENYGVKVWYIELEEGSAASTIGAFGPAILMNLDEAPWRRNYNFAHELFHLITWKSFPPKMIAEQPGLWDKLEREANAFASYLLLPAEAVTVEFDSKVKDGKLAFSDLIGIARSFDVSTEALLYSLLNLRRLDKKTVDTLLKDELFRSLDKSTMAPCWWQPPQLPERYVRLAFVAYQKGKLAKARLAELLDTSLLDLSDTLQQYGLNDREGYDAEVRTA